MLAVSDAIVYAPIAFLLGIGVGLFAASRWVVIRKRRPEDNGGNR